MTSSMPPGPAAFEVRVSGGNATLTAQLVGELDIVTAPYFEQQIDALRQDGARSLILDLATLSFIDSSGLTALVATLRRYRAEGGDVTLRSPTRATAKVLEICGLSQIFRIENAPPAGDQTDPS